MPASHTIAPKPPYNDVMQRFSYFIKRIFLMIPTFLGITVVVFGLIQFVPGGPVEQALMQMRAIGAGGEGAAGISADASAGLTEQYRREIPNNNRDKKRHDTEKPSP